MLKLTFQVPSIHRQMDKQKGLTGHLSKSCVVIVHHGKVIGISMLNKYNLYLIIHSILQPNIRQ